MSNNQYRMKVIYFKETGKFYSSGEYYTHLENIFDVFDEFKVMLEKGIRPGLINGNSGFTAILICDEHPNGFPAAFYNEA